VVPPSLFSFFLGAMVNSNTKKVIIVHDLQNVYASKSKGIFSRILVSAISFVEKRSFVYSTKIVFLSNAMKNRVRKDYGMICDNSFVAYPFVSMSENQIESPELHRRFKKEFFNIVYSGALGEKQNPHQLLEYFQKIVEKNSLIAIKIFSGGPVFDMLKEKYKQNPSIEFYDLVAENEIKQLYHLSNLQLIPQIDGSNDGSLPSKLPNLLASGVPILAISEKNGELDQILEKFESTYRVNEWSYDSIVKQLNIIIDQNKNLSHREIAKRRNADRKMEPFKIDDLVEFIIEP